MAQSILQKRDEVLNLDTLRRKGPRYEFTIDEYDDCEPSEYAVRIWTDGQDTGLWFHNHALTHARSPNLLRHFVTLTYGSLGMEITERIPGVTG